MIHRPIQKVFLVVPPTGRYIREDRCQTPIEHMKTVALRPPIDLMYAGAAFEQGGATCTLTDYPAEERNLDHLLEDIRRITPDMVLFSITTPGLEEDMRVVAQVKEACPDILTAAKGAHFNTLDAASLQRYPALDLVMRGEFEEACRELVQCGKWREIAGITYRDPSGEIIRNPDRPFVADLDSLPFPARRLANNTLYIRPDTGEMQTTLVTNRGCPFSCVYCLANQVGGRGNRVRSVDNILAEIRECIEQFGIRNFLFRSDLFTANRAWVIELCQRIRSENLDIAWVCNSRVDTLDLELLQEMRGARCWMVAFGIESGSQEMLDRIGKRTDLDAAREALRLTRKVEILSSVYFLIGLPWETLETLRANERFAHEIDPDFLEVFYVYPFPGTPLYEEAVRLGLLEEGAIPRQAYDAPVMPSLHLSREELSAARNRALRKFYLRPRVVTRTLLRARSWRERWNYFYYGWMQFKDLL